MPTKNLLEHKKLIQAGTFFWTGLVAYLCLASPTSLPSISVLTFDKLGHLVFHFGITFMWFLFWKTTRNNENKFALLKAFLFSFFFGIIIEILQKYFATNRAADVNDVYANSVGALIAVLTIVFLIKLKFNFLDKMFFLR